MDLVSTESHKKHRHSERGEESLFDRMQKEGGIPHSAWNDGVFEYRYDFKDLVDATTAQETSFHHSRISNHDSRAHGLTAAEDPASRRSRPFAESPDTPRPLPGR